MLFVVNNIVGLATSVRAPSFIFNNIVGLTFIFDPYLIFRVMPACELPSDVVRFNLNSRTWRSEAPRFETGGSRNRKAPGAPATE